MYGLDILLLTILFKFGPYYYFNYIYYNKLVLKNYKILYKKYLFYLDFFTKI